MIKLIASDMDGTLLNSKHTISKGNLKAIKKAEELGIHFTIITGRNYTGVKPIADEFNLNCEYILMNGAEYRNKNGEIVENIAIQKEKVKTIVDTMENAGLCAELFTSIGTITTDYNKFTQALEDRVRSFNPSANDEEIDKFFNEFLVRREIKVVESIEKIIEDNVDVYKILTFSSNTELIQKTKSEFKNMEGLSVVSTFANDIEICDVEAQKGLILAKVIQEMGLERDEVMVLGDSFNDYSMFTEFKNSYAMENAIPEIKEIAGYITDTNDNDGVAKAIYKALGIKN